MLKILTNTIKRKFCIAPELQNIFELIYQVKDVTIIRGLKNKQPFVTLNNKRLMLPQNSLADNMNDDLEPGQPPILFYDKYMNFYHPTTPITVICRESFYIQYKGALYFVMNNQPIIKLATNQQFLLTYCSPVLESVCKQSILGLPRNLDEPISGQNLHNLLISNMLKYGMKFKMQKIRLKQLHKVVVRQIEVIDKQIASMLDKIEKKANRRLKYYTNFLLFQYGIVHYFIYYHLSWDIMQPITVILANFDLLVAYYFFIFRGRDWTLQSMHQSYIQSRKWDFLQKNGINVFKYNELLLIKQNIEFRLALLSKNPYEIMQQLEKPIKLLDTQ